MLSDDFPRILAYREPVDMRKSFHGLVAIAQNTLGEDPLSGTLFVFRNRKGNLVKMICWDRTGFMLIAKKLEQGKFTIPGSDTTRELDSRMLRVLLDGITLGFSR